MGEAQGEVGGLTALAAARRRYSEAKRIHEANKDFGAVGEVLDYLRERAREAKEDLDRPRPTEERLENLRESEHSRIRHIQKLEKDEVDARARLSDVRLHKESAQKALKETQGNIRPLEAALAAAAAGEAELEPVPMTRARAAEARPSEVPRRVKLHDAPRGDAAERAREPPARRKQ